MWNAVPIVEKLPERTAAVFPLSKWLRTHCWWHWEPFSGPKCRILYIQPQTFSGGNIPGPPKARGTSTQTPISACHTRVPTVSLLRNDHWRGGNSGERNRTP